MKLFKKIPYLLLTLTLLLLSGCAVSHPAVDDPPAEMSPKVLNGIQTWSIKGSVSITHEKRTDIAGFTWQQEGKSNYAINFHGPLSLGTVKIIGQGGEVTLVKSKNQVFTASSPEALMESQLGWQIPISNMYYWIRGVPAPGKRQTSYDNTGHLVYLQQEGWELHYLEYVRVNETNLPRKIELTYPGLRIRLVIKKW